MITSAEAAGVCSCLDVVAVRIPRKRVSREPSLCSLECRLVDRPKRIANVDSVKAGEHGEGDVGFQQDVAREAPGAKRRAQRGTAPC